LKGGGLEGRERGELEVVGGYVGWAVPFKEREKRE
jgi:hypothetical protein